MELSCEIPHKYVWHNLHCHWPLVSIRPPRNKVKSHVFLQVASEIDGDYERSPLLYIYTNLGTIHTSIYRSVDGNGLAMSDWVSDVQGGNEIWSIKRLSPKEWEVQHHSCQQQFLLLLSYITCPHKVLPLLCNLDWERGWQLKLDMCYALSLG